jgi:hypothetical protein
MGSEGEMYKVTTITSPQSVFQAHGSALEGADSESSYFPASVMGEREHKHNNGIQCVANCSETTDYRVKWRDYPATQNSWEPKASLSAFGQDVLQAYHKKAIVEQSLLQTWRSLVSEYTTAAANDMLMEHTAERFALIKRLVRSKNELIEFFRLVQSEMDGRRIPGPKHAYGLKEFESCSNPTCAKQCKRLTWTRVCFICSNLTHKAPCSSRIPLGFPLTISPAQQGFIDSSTHDEVYKANLFCICALCFQYKELFGLYKQVVKQIVRLKGLTPEVRQKRVLPASSSSNLAAGKKRKTGSAAGALGSETQSSGGGETKAAEGSDGECGIEDELAEYNRLMYGI